LAETPELFEGFCGSKAFQIHALGKRNVAHLGANYCGNYLIRFQNLQGSLDGVTRMLGLGGSFVAIPVTKNTGSMSLINFIESFCTT
jgi:hypothetical protein